MEMLNSNQTDRIVTFEAVKLALELARWYRPVYSEDDILAFLAERTSDEKVKDKAIILWVAAVTGISKKVMEANENKGDADQRP